MIETGAAAAGIAQRLALIIAERQRTDTAMDRGIGEADDDEFLTRGAFRLEPVARAALAVSEVGAFRDDTLEAELRCLREDIRTVRDDMIRIDQRPDAATEQIAQCRLAIDQLGAAPILAVAIEQVEDDVAQRLGLFAR